ncbi:MAG: hypothetical protein VYC52_08670, partial [Pseudomonadota bacterium]|nr:hypothetical protein [Pseudomonadota bacterium]
MKYIDLAKRVYRNWLGYCCLLAVIWFGSSFGIVPTPAPDQEGPIALTGAVIHDGNGNIIGDGVITFDEGIITEVGSADDAIDLQNHEVF